MKPQKAVLLFSIAICILSSSCAGGKYKYQFDTGKHLDFGTGKWIFNQTKSNASPRYDQRLYHITYDGFKKILGDSLANLTVLRNSALVRPKIEQEPSQNELTQLYIDSGYNYLININGKIRSNGASSISFNDPNSNSVTSNSAAVFVKIYDLESGILISAATAKGIVTDKNSKFDKDGAIRFNSRAEPIMLEAAGRLINKYQKYRTDK